MSQAVNQRHTRHQTRLLSIEQIVYELRKASTQLAQRGRA